jgi:putative ABC transport system ATP-binding protein
MILQSQNLECRRGPHTLRFPDIALDAGQSLLLLGASGSGKTSLLSILSGLLKPDKGDVTLVGENIYTLPSWRRDAHRGRQCGFVFQSFHLLPFLSLEQNILLAARFSGASKNEDRLSGLLTTLGITHKRHALVTELSQGEQQRACLARAVIHGPRIIFADEPTSALDDENALKTISLLQSLAKESKACLIVATHDSRIMDGFDIRLMLERNAA